MFGAALESESAILLRDEGEPSGINRIYRLYREEGLAVRKRRTRRKAVGTRAPILTNKAREGLQCVTSAGTHTASSKA
jgi:transposase InsO family protein